MDWGDVPAWVALGLSGGAAWIALLARRDGRRSADASEISALASQRSADIAEQSLALQREVADEQRAATAPRVRLVVERLGRTRYRLRNAGDAVAGNVQIVSPREELPYLFRWEHDGVTLVPDDNRPMTMQGAAGRPMPSSLLVQWDGQLEPVPVSISATTP